MIFNEPKQLRYIDRAWRNDDGDPVDMVEVVRCKDCLYRRDEGFCPMFRIEHLECEYDGYMDYREIKLDNTVDNGFCNWGERRTDNAVV